MDKNTQMLSTEQKELIVLALEQLKNNLEGQGSLQIDITCLLSLMQKEPMVLGSQNITDFDIIIISEVTK